MQRAAIWIERVLIVAFAIVLILLPLHAFLSTWGGTQVGPILLWKSWKEILLVALLPLSIAYLGLRPDIARQFFASWVVRFILLYLLLHIGYAVFSPASPEAVMAGMLMNLRFFAIFLVGYLIFLSNNSWVPAVKKAAVPWLLVVATGLAVMAIVQVAFLPKDFLAQFGYSDDTIAPYILVDENPNALRAFATMRGPNDLGAYLLLPLALAVVIVVTHKNNILAGLALGLGVVALWLTSSRSAWLGAVVMAAVLLIGLLPRLGVKKWLPRVALALVVLGTIGLWLVNNVPAVRLAIFHSSPGDSSLLEGSSDKHLQATSQGVADVMGHPFGQGVGTAGPASFYGQSPKIAENYFVQIAQEVGVFGLIVLLTIMTLVVYNLWRQRADLMPRVLGASFIGLSVVSLFLHGWADDPTAMTWWALAGLYMYNAKKAAK